MGESAASPSYAKLLQTIEVVCAVIPKPFKLASLAAMATALLNKDEHYTPQVRHASYCYTSYCYASYCYASCACPRAASVRGGDDKRPKNEFDLLRRATCHLLVLLV